MGAGQRPTERGFLGLSRGQSGADLTAGPHAPGLLAAQLQRDPAGGQGAFIRVHEHRAHLGSESGGETGDHRATGAAQTEEQDGGRPFHLRIGKGP